MNYHYLSNWKDYLILALLFIVLKSGAEQIPEINTRYSANWSQRFSKSFKGQSELIYDTLLNYGPGKSAYTLPPGWDAPVNTGKSTGVIIALEADPKINDVSINLGDAIGAFFINDEGEMQCAGVTYWPDTNGIVMTVYGDNTATPEKDGFSNGEYMNYKIFSREYCAEFDVDVIELDPDPDFYPNNVWIKLAIPRLIEMTCYEDLWIKATADNDSLCNGAPVSFDIEIIEGTGNITYNWSSIPPGFSSTLPNPVFNLTETTLFSVEATDGINQFTALQEIYVSNDPVVFAGENIATCGVEMLNLAGSADFVSNIYWTSSGDGTFLDSTSLGTDYFLGPDDFQSDEILFSLIGQPVAPCQNLTSDEMVVSIYPTPIIILPESFNTCKYQPVLLVAEGANLSDVLWETGGNGTFSDPTSLTTTYFHGTYGSSHSSVTLTLTGHGIAPCNFTIIEQTELYINKNAFCSSGPDATICSNQTFETSGGAAYADSIIWTTNGDGTFEDNTLLKALYFPGIEDINNSSVDLTIHVTSAPPCTAAPYSEMTLNINDGAIVDAGADIGACGNPIVQINATAEVYSSVEWFTSGSGTFDNINELSTIYTASAADLDAGIIELTIQAYAIDPCTQGSFDALIVNFEGGTTASAGPDMTVCHDESAFIQGWAINYQDLLWTTSGDGDFNEPNSPVTLYTPGPNDIMNGEVTLSIHPEGIPPCTGGMIDEMILSIVSPAILSVTNTEIQVCENDNAYLNANATNFSYILWTSSGDGVFDNEHSLSPIYSPGIQDIQTGTATLEISITSIQPCTDLLNEVVELNIFKEPVAYAGNNGSVCIGSNYAVNGTIFNGDESEWTTSGDGYFENPFATGTTYHPGSNDLQQASVTLTLNALPVVPCEVSDLDDLILYIIANPTCNAGNNKIICEGSSLDLSGSASNYQNIYWETAGDGSFSDINDLNSTYFPGQDDIENELVTLTLTAVAQSPCSILAQDNMDITIESSATANAGADITICETDVANITGVAQGYQAVSWNSDGDGIFENSSSLSTIYEPGPNDLINRDIELCLTVYGTALCGSVSSCINVHLEYIPVVNAGEDNTSPVNTPYYTEGSEAYYHSSVLWTTSGTGTFNNPDFISNHYTPSQSDLNNSPVNLTLTAQPENACVTVVSDSFILYVIPDCVDASAYAGTDATLCVSQFNDLMLSDAQADNAETVFWSTNGDGVFTNNTLLQPTYIAGAGDKQNGTVELCLTAKAYGTCGNDVDCLTLTLQQPPTANAGDDQSICEGDFVSLTGQANYATNTLWTSEGDGSFENDLSQETNYIPGVADIENGSVELCLDAFGIGDCATAQSCVDLTIQKLPFVYIGEDMTVCSNSTIELNGEVDFIDGLQWSTNGSGTFSNPENINTTYYPSTQDVLQGFVEVCIEAFGIGACENQQICKIISFEDAPTANAGTDLTICEGQSASLMGIAENYSSIQWISQGDGTFDNIAITDAKYFPGPSDIITGEVELCMEAIGTASCDGVTDCMTLEILKNSEVFAGEDLIYNAQQPVTTNDAWTYNSSAVYWETSGTGTFNNSNILVTTYNPSFTDFQSGAIVLSLFALPQSPCTITNSDDLLVEFLFDCYDATAIAGEDASVCGGSDFQVNGEAFEYSSLIWASSGNGTFNNAYALDAIYTPSEDDILSGQVDLCLTAFANGDCEDATDCMSLTFLQPVIASAGSDNTAPFYEPYTFPDAYAENASLIQWSLTNGIGELTNENSIYPTYYPNFYDTYYQVQINLAATSNSPCTVAVYDALVLTFTEECADALANAGEDITMCEGNIVSEVSLENAFAHNFKSLLWSTSGDGTFNFSNILNPVYTLGSNDLSSGNVELSLFAESFDACNSASDQLIIQTSPGPSANAGNDFTVCGIEGIPLFGSASGYSDLQWTTNGDGQFIDASGLNPIYYPGSDDMENGSAELCLLVLGSGDCNSASDCMSLTIIPVATVNAGNDDAICVGELYQLNAAASDYSALLWNTNGDGTFSDDQILNPVYTPGIDDLQADSAILMLTAFGMGECADITGTLVLSVVAEPIAFAGEDATINQGENYHLQDATAENTSSILWESSGFGSFENNESINTIYFPVQEDFPEVTLTLNALPLEPCTVSSIDEISITILEVCQDAMADAGDDIYSCDQDEVQLSGSAQNEIAVLWTSDGDGNFDDNTSATATYYPGEADIANGTVNLCLTAFADGSCQDAQDCMVVNFEYAPSANAGLDDVICETESYQLNGASENFASVLWQTNGDGTFDNPTSLSPVYYPGAGDKETGFAELLLSAYAEALCEEAIDNMVLSIDKTQQVNAGSDLNICESGFAQLNGLTENTTELLWETDGDGNFDDNTSATATYYPGESDIANGTVNLCLTAFADGSCQDAQDCMVVNIEYAPSANAGLDDVICETGSYQLNGAAENFASVYWETNGDGTFNDPASLTSVYYPGVDDVETGFAELLLSAYAEALCEEAIDNMILSIDKSPEVNAGSDLNICESGFTQLNGLTENTTGLLWESDGDGSFDDYTSATATYYPGEGDIANGTVNLCLTAFSDGSCQDTQDCMVVNFDYAPSANAGLDDVICETGSYQLNGAAENFASVYWETNGDGTFNDPASLTSVYYPGVDDVETGFAELLLSAYAEALCEEAIDNMILSIDRSPEVNAGSDLNICESGFTQLNGLTENTTGLLWESDGDGSFDDYTSATATYYPGEGDIANGTVNLCLTAFSDGSCQDTQDCMVVNFDYAPSANAGLDDVICETESYQLNGAAENFTSVLWETNGDGTFDDPASLTSVYYPGESDLSEGEAQLCFTAYHSGLCPEANDCMTLMFQKQATAYAGEDDTLAELGTFTTDLAEVANSNEFFWSTSGTGSFDDSNYLITTYTPTYLDYQNNGVFLTLTAMSVNPCNIATSDSLALSLDNPPCFNAVANAGEDASVCGGADYQLNGEALEYSSAIWASSGTGTFDDAGAPDATYSPSEDDILSGQVDLCLTAFANGDCEDATDCMSLTFVQPVIASAGSDNTAPYNEPYTFPDAYAQNASLIQWSLTGGIGELINDNTIHPTYYPNFYDTYTQVQLNFAATSNSPCIVAVYDILLLTFTEECADAIADAGENISICANDSVIQLQAYAANFSNLFWTTAGDGTFTFGNSASPKYTLGSIDQISDEVMLYFHVESFGDCSPAIDSVLVSPLIMPQVDAGPNQTICEAGVVVTDQANVLNASSVEWSTSGDGTFSDVNNVLTQYTPGQQDIADQTLLLTLSALSLQPCQLTISKSFQLTIDMQPEVLVELEDIEATIGEDVPLVLISKYAEEYQWYGPDGIINGETLPVLLLYEVDFDDAGYYYCELINDCGITTSNEAKVSVYEQQSISIPAGWSGISSFITPGNSLLDNIFSDYMDDLVMLKNFSGIYNPGIGVNTLVNWDKMAGYEVNFDQAVEFKISGVVNENRTLTINEGWNIIPVISSCPVDIDSLVEGHTDEVDIIKEIAGYGVYWPAIGINTIGDFIPGKAYCMRANEPFDITYEPCESTKSSYISNLSSPVNQTPWNDMHLSLATHTIAFDQLLLDELEIGDVIGAFTSSGRCAGYLEIKAEDNVLVLFGDDPISAEVDGFVENEPIHFRIYKTAAGKEVDFYPEFSNAYPQNDGVFVNNGMSRLIKASVNGIGNDGSTASNISIYPNPTFGKIMISGLTEGSTIEICNSEGQLLREINFNTTDEYKLLDVDLSDFSSGMVYVRIFNHDQVIIKKIVLR